MRLHFRTNLNNGPFEHKKYKWGRIIRLYRYSLCIDFDGNYAGKIIFERSKQTTMAGTGEDIEKKLKQCGITWNDVDENGKFTLNGKDYIIGGFARYKTLRKRF